MCVARAFSQRRGETIYYSIGSPTGDLPFSSPDYRLFFFLSFFLCLRRRAYMSLLSRGCVCAWDARGKFPGARASCRVCLPRVTIPVSPRIKHRRSRADCLGPRRESLKCGQRGYKRYTEEQRVTRAYPRLAIIPRLVEFIIARNNNNNNNSRARCTT